MSSPHYIIVMIEVYLFTYNFLHVFRDIQEYDLLAEWLAMKSVTLLAVQSMPLSQLDDLLCIFYKEVRTKHGYQYKEYALKCIRSGLTKYLSCLRNPGCDFRTLATLPKSQQAYVDVVSKQPSKVTEMLSVADCVYLRGHKLLCGGTPKSLLCKVWFELQLHFGMRGWSPREMWSDLFVFKDIDGTQYVALDQDQVKLSKTIKAEMKCALLKRSMVGSDSSRCPVSALRFYLTKRVLTPNKLSKKVPFLQKPNHFWTPGSNVPWFTPFEISLGLNNSFMHDLCDTIRLDKSYTNMSMCMCDPSCYLNAWP